MHLDTNPGDAKPPIFFVQGRQKTKKGQPAQQMLLLCVTTTLAPLGTGLYV